jgi:hypothetical protein
MKMKKWTILHGNFLPSLPGSGKFVKVSIPPGPFGGGQNVYLQINRTKINVTNINVLQINGVYIYKNLLKYRTKCHLKMLCRSTALYINHC